MKPSTKNSIAQTFLHLDYEALGKIYCDEGGEAFWQHRQGPCQRLGKKIASHLNQSLAPKGRSLYIGAGVAELPMLIVETADLDRSVFPYSLRKKEVAILNKACTALPFQFLADNALHAQGKFDHLWLVSVLNDPECYPQTSALSYGRATPFDFDPDAYKKEQYILLRLIHSCLRKLSIPGLVTTSVEEVPWITTWCLEHNIPFHLESKTFPTAIVGDPLCFIHLDETPPPKASNQKEL
ncbi:hypothetical protein [Candidatus Nitronereus thalassa]|uniref:Uncharacterized protein n=1 Tax=Candidatus Nitronereus thalassa TaxID=3020898 RepID=A0ABU3K5L6_9BACT|nr:hypothetical protein [Candidatus Nitronereus thalassa]MDT7041685.1 hypothetical protein [Candidatus Nitronereus thalassa]